MEGRHAAPPPSLLDGLTTKRIEIDLVDFSGSELKRVDNRVMSFRLVQLGLTGAAMFSAAGKVLQPSEVLYRNPVLVERGRFRPVTYVNLDLAASALRAFEAEGGDVAPGETVSIMEITMRNLLADGDVDLSNFLSRADVVDLRIDFASAITDFRVSSGAWSRRDASSRARRAAHNADPTAE